MVLKIRFRQQGRKNRTSYRLVVTDSRSPRDGKYVESLGWYDPLKSDEENASFVAERVSFWLSKGAQLSEKAAALIRNKTPDVMHHHNKVATDRRARIVKKRREAKQKAK